MSRLFSFILIAATLVPGSAESARVKGTVRRARVEPISETLGYTVTQIAAPAKALEQHLSDVVIFLRARNSKRNPEATEHPKIAIRGLRFVPELVGCEVDAQVILVNEESQPLSLVIGDEDIGVVKPNEERTYSCVSIKGDAEFELRPIKVKEWPHMRGAIHVGDIGVVAMPDARGSFELKAVEGEYVLNVVGMKGVLAQKDIQVGTFDVDAGTFDLRPEDQRTEPVVAPPPPVKPRPPPRPPKEGEGDEGEPL